MRLRPRNLKRKTVSVGLVVLIEMTAHFVWIHYHVNLTGDWTIHYAQSQEHEQLKLFMSGDKTLTGEFVQGQHIWPTQGQIKGRKITLIVKLPRLEETYQATWLNNSLFSGIRTAGSKNEYFTAKKNKRSASWLAKLRRLLL